MSSSEDEDGAASAKKQVRRERKTADYKGLPPKLQHYLRNDMYIGSDKKKKFTTYVFSAIHDDELENPKLVEKTINTPQGVARLFLEILSNASDNLVESRNKGVDGGHFEIKMNETTISIKNFGIPIPVLKKGIKTSKEGIKTMCKYKEGMKEHTYPPEFIFGRFLTSSNYDDDVVRMGAGKNGMGSKLCNLYSTRFRVVAEDHEHGNRFEGIWKDNFFKDDPDGKPEIKVKEKKIKKGSVLVEWDLDFERFKMREYSGNDISYFAKIAIDFSFSSKVKIIFNGKTLDYRGIRKYASLYFLEEDIENSIIQYTWGIKKKKGRGKDTIERRNIISNKKNDKMIENPKNSEDLPDMEIMIMDTPDSDKVISYVNGLITADHGVHVDAVHASIGKYFMSAVNGDKKKDKLNITVKDVKPHLSMIVNCRIPNPQHAGQTKTKLESPEMTIEIEKTLLKRTNNWRTIERLIAAQNAKGFKLAGASDARKVKTLPGDGKAEDANYAGGKESMDCVLYMCEGDSASSYPQKRISFLKGGKNYNGYIPLRGKFLNVVNADIKQYSNSKLIAKIKEMMGFREGADYSLKENQKTLRYGYIIVVGDADVDGMHIVALLLNLLNTKFKGMLLTNRVSYLRTPVIKIYKGNKIVKRFFAESDFERWKNENPKEAKSLRIRYLKGLGTSSDSDIQDDVDTASTVICFYDSKANENLDLAFRGKRSDDRKEWIEKWRDISQTKDVLSVDLSKIKPSGLKGLYEGQDISQFINRELVGYSVSSLYRAIPSEYDHFKESQRKIIYGALLHFNFSCGKKDEPVKVDTLSSEASARLHYHHGVKNLQDTLIKLTQDFIGSNNLGFCTKDGQFGSRTDGGKKAAAARYSEVRLNWWVPFVFYKESIELIQKREIEGKLAEPFWLPAVIPMGSANGTLGIATGFSSYTAPHNPLDLVGWCKNKCRGLETEELIPWFNGFKGKITVESGKKKREVEEETENDLFENGDEEIGEVESDGGKEIKDDFDAGIEEAEKIIQESNKISKKRLKTTGSFKITGRTKNEERIIKITELPIRTYTMFYSQWLGRLSLERGKNKLISEVNDNSNPVTGKVNIEIKWKNKNVEPTHHNLRLQKTFGLSNITFIDHYGFPRKYADDTEVLETYYKHMIEHYTELRAHRIKVEEDRIQYATWKQRFIQAVLDKEIKLIKTDEEIMKKKLDEIGVPWKVYDDSKSRDFSKQSLSRWEKEIEKAKAKVEEAKKSTAESIWLEKLVKLEKELLKRWDPKEKMFKT